MDKIKFNYRTHELYPVQLNISQEEIAKFEADCKDKLQRKYSKSLISPSVEVIISKDGTKILNIHAFAEGILQ
ncbi:MAG: hypothetical protein JWR09_2540 [Mucilaginibacter sp.]|nr:hypothetical protein [Mucilaginibacter sp.]